jgi:pimeloyl-ACP methyl ester carboxylesterase
LISLAGQGSPFTLTPDVIGPLTERYRVGLIDITPVPTTSGEDCTAEKVCAAIFAAATRAKIDRFAWYGFSFGGVVGLQLGTRSDRVNALIVGGWPPLGAQYRETLAVVEADATRYGSSHFVTFYRGLQDWPERDAIAKLTCPRLAFAGADDQIEVAGQKIHIGPTLAEHKTELEGLGWTVELRPGFRHDIGARPDILVPLLRGFLDSL